MVSLTKYQHDTVVGVLAMSTEVPIFAETDPLLGVALAVVALHATARGEAHRDPHFLPRGH